MPQLNVRNATFRGCRCHTWTAVKCGITGVEVWHLPCSGVGFGVLRCGVLRAPRMRCLVPESSRIRSGRGIIGNGATQIGASAVDELFVAVEVGWGGGLLPGVDGKQSCIQGLRGAWLFGIVVEVVAGFLPAVYVLLLPVQQHVVLEYFQGLFESPAQQGAEVACHADSVFPFAVFCQAVYQFPPGTKRRHGILRSMYFSVVVVLFNDEVVFSILIFSALIFSTLIFSYVREGRFFVFIADILIVIIAFYLFNFFKSFQVVW